MRKRLYPYLSLFMLFLPSYGESQPIDVLMVVQGASINGAARLDIVKTAIDTLVKSVDKGSRLGLLEFDATATQIRQLEPVTSEQHKDPVTTVLIPSQSIDQNFNSATALEYAIYNLRTEGNTEAAKTVIMIGDGITSDSDVSESSVLTQWLKAELSDEARQAGIKIYWMTLTESADYQSIQGVTQKTKGQYYRTFTPEHAHANILSILSSVNQKFISSDSTQAGSRSEAEAENNTIIDRLMSYPVATFAATVALSGIAAMVIGFVIYFRRDSRTKNEDAKHTRRAGDLCVTLRDISEFTAMSVYDITGHRTYIGRLPREVTERSCVVVIRDATVGRNHATIEYRDHGYWLTDHGTVNGTYINGIRLQGTKRLSSGDRIRFARFEFKIHIPDNMAVDTESASQEQPVLDQKSGITDTITSRDDDRTVFRSKA